MKGSPIMEFTTQDLVLKIALQALEIDALRAEVGRERGRADALQGRVNELESAPAQAEPKEAKKP